jgi:NAD(P)-dependent dehydrogenase (short-subunit alcohol dehydrogenase family)
LSGRFARLVALDSRSVSTQALLPVLLRHVAPYHRAMTQPEAEHVAFITGAGRGIGAAIARRLAKDGVHVLLGARTVAVCEALADELRGAGCRASAVELDVASPDSVRAAVAAARELVGRERAIDWLINNAGIAQSAPLVPREAPEELFDRHLQVNFHGARRMLEALLPEMKRLGYGRIVNVASSAALMGYRYVAAYCASKHALLGYSRAAALELEGSGVALAVVCPHYVDSPMTDESARRIAQKTGQSEAEARALLAAQNPSGVLVRPEQIAEVVAQLCARGDNGALVELDGAEPRYHPRSA